MRTADFDYPLPRELIAQEPLESRERSRLLVLGRADGAVRHRCFFELGEYLRPGDILVVNDSRVIPARLRGRKAGSRGEVELLLLRRLEDGLWEAAVHPGRRLGIGTIVQLGRAGVAVTAQVVERTPAGTRIIRFDGDPEPVGEIPLPPYIHVPLNDPERYQTVYARVQGSAAAPTAGLHFTTELMERLKAQEVEFAFVTLHIGLDTFRPVASEDPREHPIHREYAELSPEVAERLSIAKAQGRRLIAVGTTVVRVLEEAALRSAPPGQLAPLAGEVGLFILPGHRFRAVDGLITNFHLPRSTLLMLVCAFAGRERVLEAYAEAAAQGYRFYSFGDAMLIT